MSPKITALLQRFMCVSFVDGKVIEMERLNESKIKTRAVRLFEKKYSCSAIAKKLVAV